MCGILVDLRFRGSPDPAPLQRGLDVLRPRGPDDCTVLARGPVWMGHTRLAMVAPDLGAQPIVDPERDVVVVFNGELYNADAVAHDLKRAGLSVPAGSDARVVAPLYARFGLDFVHHLEGEWAVVLWDGRRQRLVAARDPFGVRPLFLARDPWGVRLASSAQALVAAGTRAAWNARAVAQVFQHQYLLPGETVFQDIEAILPGGLCVVQDREVRQERWWRLPVCGTGERSLVSGAELLAVLDQSVRRRLRGDAILGVQLSGGVDSATVAMLAARAGGVRTAWTLAFVDDPVRDEARLAATVAEAAGLEHRVVAVTQDALLDDLQASVVAGGAPVINLHGVARYHLSRAVRAAGVHGLLTGEGADELLFGYAHLRHDFAREQGQGVRAERGEPVAAAVHLPWGAALDTGPIRRQLGGVPTFLEAKAALAARARAVLRSPHQWPCDFSGLLGALCTGHLDVSAAPGGPPSGVQHAAWLWTHLCLSGSILSTLCDPQELGHGVEGRLPFLDAGVVRLAMRMSDAQKLDGGIEKALLREAVGGLVPDAVRLRPKQPFMAPSLVGTPRLRDLLSSLDMPPFLSRPAVFGVLDRMDQTDGIARSALDPVLCLALSLAVLHTHHRMDGPS